MTAALATGTEQVAAALVAAQAEASAVFKSRKNTAQHYNYAGLEDFVETARPILSAHGLALTFSVINAVPMDARTTKGGGVQYAVLVNLEATLYHQSGQSLRFAGAGEGQDSGDKAVYKAITGARKYLIAQVLNLTTTDDPEADGPAPQQYQRPAQQQRQQAPPPAQRPPADAVDAMDDNTLAERAAFLSEAIGRARGLGAAEILATASTRAGKAGVGKLEQFFAFAATDPQRHAAALDLLRFAVRRMEATYQQEQAKLAQAATVEPPDEIPF